LVTRFIGGFGTITAAKKARERFIAQVANLDVGEPTSIKLCTV
jgi:hypothetical protein